MSQPREAVEAHQIVPGRNRSGADIGKGLVVRVDPGNGPDAVELATAATQVFHGITLEAIANGKNGDVAQGGLVVAVAGEQLTTEGVRLTADGSGRVVEADTDNNNIIGTLNTLAAQAGDLVEVFVVAPGAHRGS